MNKTIEHHRHQMYTSDGMLMDRASNMLAHAIFSLLIVASKIIPNLPNENSDTLTLSPRLYTEVFEQF